jgi:uncharacterized protein (DUF2267 family)
MSAPLEGTPGDVSSSGLGLGTSRASFLAKVEGRLMGEPADEAAEAVFCTLSEQLSGAVVRMIQDALPEDLRDLFETCGAHAGGKEEAAAVSKDDFYLAVAEHLGSEPEDTRRIISAVFHGLHSQITEAISEKVAAQLPSELRGTWVNARKAVAAPH